SSCVYIYLKPQSSVDQLEAKTMLKRHRSRENQTKKRLCLSLEFLPHDLVELILQRLPVKPLLRFKSVSKNWKSTIESQRFQERNLICSRQALGPDVLLVSLCEKGDAGLSGHARTVMFSLATASKVRFPFSGSMFCYGHCDGLVCFYCVYAPSFVMNPATKWHRSFPLSGYQQLVIERYNRLYFKFISFKLGLGRDKFRGTYKAVWLYSSSEYGLDNVTTCELFDFSTNAWRYVFPASPYRISAYNRPVYLDGSLYWLTECKETKVLSFDVHTETFQVLCKAPFAHLSNPCNQTICILNDRLCVSLKNWPMQVIWSFDSSGGSNTWKKMCSIDLTKTFPWFGKPEFALLPIAVREKKWLLLQGRDFLDPVVIYNLHKKSYRLFYKPREPVGPVYYLQSLFSA
ncbi:F-box associated interaction domain, partial [Arabidopsis thaliana x Arabidopsis arenosa]